MSRLSGVALLAVVVGLNLTGCTSSANQARPQVRVSRIVHAVAPAATTSGRPISRGGRNDAFPAIPGAVIGIDPGHNGGNFADPGYINQMIFNGREMEHCNTTGTATDAGYTEARFTWHVARDLARDIREAGGRVVLTRRNNHGAGPCVNRRAEIINAAHAAVAIDIHADGGPATGRGFAILVPVRDSANAGVVGSSRRYGRILRNVFRDTTGMPVSTYDGVNGIQPRDDLAGLNLTTVPQVLIECGNMRNAIDAALLTSPRFQRRAALAIERAMNTFLLARRR